MVVRKSEIHRIVDELPDDAVFDDLIHKLYVMDCIEQGLEAGKQGRVTDVKDVPKSFGLST